MPTQCVDEHFQAPAGVLDFTAVVPVTLVHDVSHASSNNGAFTTQRSLPGTNHQDWTIGPITNTYAVPVLAVFEVMCLGAFIIAPQPNLTLVRTRVTVGVGGAADTPDITAEFDSEFGGGFDITDQDTQSNPETGRLHRGTAAWVIRKTPVELQPGQALYGACRIASYTPDPWLANANNNSPGHQADVKTSYSRVWFSALGYAG